MPESEARRECYSRARVRGQLDPIKEGQLFDLELEELGSEAAVAEKYKVSRSYVAGRRTLLRAPRVFLGSRVPQVHPDPWVHEETLALLAWKVQLVQQDPPGSQVSA